MADGEVIFEIRGDSSGLSGDLDEAEGKVRKSGGNLASIAKGAGVAIGGALISAGAASIKFGSEFEQSMANASTMLGDITVDTENLNSKILEMSDSTGIAASEFGDGLYQALSAGIPVTEDMASATEFMEKNAKLAKAGFTDLTSAVDVSTSVLMIIRLIQSFRPLAMQS